MPKFSFPGRIPSFNLVVNSYSNKNFTANNKNINNINKNFNNNNNNIKNFNKNLKNNNNRNINNGKFPYYIVRFKRNFYEDFKFYSSLVSILYSTI